MKMNFKDFTNIYTAVFDTRNEYPGYKPSVVESPDGNDVWDLGKKYAHINYKHLEAYGMGPDWYLMDTLFDDSMEYARGVAMDLGIQEDFWPTMEDSTIRILGYPPGAGSATHTDFDLFTLPLFRSMTHAGGEKGYHNVSLHLQVARERYPGINFGEIMEQLSPEWSANTHHVGTSKLWQYSAVFFAMPPLDAKFPSGHTVREWLEERKSRSRKEV